MHKLYDFACKELEELEGKIGAGFTSADLEYATKLTELKKNILKVSMLENDSYRGTSSLYNGNSRGRMRYPMRYGYSMAAEDIISQLEDMRETAPDEMSRIEISKLINKMRNI